MERNLYLPKKHSITSHWKCEALQKLDTHPKYGNSSEMITLVHELQRCPDSAQSHICISQSRKITCTYLWLLNWLCITRLQISESRNCKIHIRIVFKSQLNEGGVDYHTRFRKQTNTTLLHFQNSQFFVAWNVHNTRYNGSQVKIWEIRLVRQ